MLDTNAVIEFLTSEEALELPDKIEEVEKQNPDMIIITGHFFSMILIIVTLIRWTMRTYSG